MNILALNASPRMTEGNTHRILAPFMEGAAETGATVETVYVRKLQVKPCTACMSCWFRTPGQCAQRDDMTDLCRKVHEADVFVLATPVYVDGMVGALKVVLDRMIPLVRPEMELIDGHMRHSAVEGHKATKVLLVSVCGFHEMDNFDPLVMHVQAVCRNLQSEYAGALLRPHAHGMEALENFGRPATAVFEACRTAGRQIVTEGRITSETFEAVSRSLMPRTIYLYGANSAMQQTKRKHGTA